MVSPVLPERQQGDSLALPNLGPTIRSTIPRIRARFKLCRLCSQREGFASEHATELEGQTGAEAQIKLFSDGASKAVP